MPKHRDELIDESVDSTGAASGGSGFFDDILGLREAARSAFASEIAFQKARATLAGKLVGKIAGLAALVLALVFFVLMALVVGPLLALSPVLGPWGALGVVLLGLLVLIGVSVVLILSAVRRLKWVLAERTPDDDGAAQ